MQFTNPLKWSVDPQSTLEVGWALKGDPTHGGKYQSLKAFSPIPLSVFNRPPFADPDPPPPAAPAPPRPAPAIIPKITGDGNQTNPPISGYLPYAESGHIDFSPADGSLTGRLWFTIAGGSSFSKPFHVYGRFKFNLDDTDNYSVGAEIARPIGMMSFLFVSIDGFDTSPFVWDYSFIMVSNDEAQLITAGRLPRPATASGTMRRADWQSIPRLPFGVKEALARKP